MAEGTSVAEVEINLQGPSLESKKVESLIDIKSYNQEVEKKIEKSRGEARKTELVGEMHQTHEILDVEHPFNQTVKRIVSKLRPDKEFDVVISLTDTEKRLTLLGADTHIVSAGFISKFEAFLKERGRPLTEDHLAMLIAHEMAHGDPEAKVAYLNEKYCDTKGVSMVDKAGFNLQCAVETLEFFEELTYKPNKEERNNENSRRQEDKSLVVSEDADQKNEDSKNDEENKSEVEITDHKGTSNAENRRILGYLIANDSTIHLNGRYAKETPLTGDYTDFKDKSGQWLAQVEARYQIASEADVIREFDNCHNISEILETFYNTEHLRHADISRQFANSKEFERLLLVAAIYRSYYVEHLSLLDRRDFLAQKRSNASDKPQGESVILDEDQKPIDNPRYFEHCPNRDIRKLVVSILNGKYDNPLDLLSLPNEELQKRYPEFKPVEPGKFIRELRKGTEKFKEVLGVDLQDVSARDLLEGTKVALASSYIRAMEKSLETPKEFDKGNDIIRHNMSTIAKLTDKLDHDQLNSLIQQALLKTASCRTPQAAQIIANTFIRSGYFAPSSYYDIHNQKDLTPEIFQDLRDSLFSQHFGLSGGGERTNQGWIDPVFMGNFIENLRSLYYESQSALNGKSSFELVELLDSTSPSIGGPHSAKSLNLIPDYLKNRNYDSSRAKDDFRAGGSERVVLHAQSYYEEYKERYTYDSVHFTPEQVEKLVFESVNRRRDLVGAFIASEYGRNPEFVRNIIQKGVQEKKLTPGEIEAMLLKCNDLSLYRDYLPFVRDNKREKFHNRWLGEVIRRHNSRNYNTEYLIEFIKEGGVADMVWHHDNLRGIWMSIDPLEVNAKTHNHDYYSPKDARLIADAIVEQTSKPDSQYSVEARKSVLNVAACLIRYAEGMPFLRDPIRARMGDEKVNVIKNISSYMDKIKKMPVSEYRDNYIENGIHFLLESEQPDMHALTELMTMYTPDHFIELDSGSADAPRVDLFSYKKQVYLTPLREGVFDISEHFAFRYPPDHQWTDVRILEAFAKHFDQNFPVTIPREVLGKINRIEEVFQNPSVARDFMIERTLSPVLRQEGLFSDLSDIDRLSILHKAFESASTARTKQKIGLELTHHELRAWQERISFDQAVQVVMRYLPKPSTERDRLITDLLDSSYTTWQQIAQSQEMILGYNYATDEKGVASRNAMVEYIFREIGDMPKDDRVETLLFLLNPTKHVITPDGLTKDFFDDYVETRLKAKIHGQIKGAYYPPWYDKEFASTKSTIEDYLIQKLKGHSAEGIPLDRLLKESVDKLTFADIANCALPPSLESEVKEHFSEWNSPTKAATSFGLFFATTNPFERRQLIYRLSLGNHGFFEDLNFQKQGIKTIAQFFNLATKDNTQVVEGGSNKSSWTDREKEIAQKVLIDIFSSLNPARRTELLSKMINLIAESGGQASKEQLIEIALTSFGVVGVKVGQMDALMPDYLRTTLGSLKENVAPIPKLTVAKRLAAEGRTKNYSGLGKSVGGGSVASTYLARSNGSETDNVVIKMIRPDVVSTYEQDLRVAAGVINTLARDGVLRVNADQVTQEMGQLITEEINPQVEAANIARIQESRSIKGGSKVGSAEILYVGANHLEMKRANGISLARLEQIAAKKAKGEALDEVEQQFASVDIFEVYEDILSDFFHQAFIEGAFHADLHQGNIFISPNQEITEIDHGQIGTETSVKRRNSLVKYVVGAVLKQPTIIAQAISEFGSTPLQEIEAYLSNQPDILLGVSKFLFEHQASGSINRFTKALINIYPYMEKLKGKSSGQKINLGTIGMFMPDSVKTLLNQNATLTLMLLPYVANKAMLVDISRTLPTLQAQQRARTVPSD